MDTPDLRLSLMHVAQWLTIQFVADKCWQVQVQHSQPLRVRLIVAGYLTSLAQLGLGSAQQARASSDSGSGCATDNTSLESSRSFKLSLKDWAGQS